MIELVLVGEFYFHDTTWNLYTEMSYSNITATNKENFSFITAKVYLCNKFS